MFIFLECNAEREALKGQALETFTLTKNTEGSLADREGIHHSPLDMLESTPLSNTAQHGHSEIMRFIIALEIINLV